MTGENAKSSPINTLLSGPAGGVIGGLFIAKTLDHPNLITIDVGGTSFDVCMIKDGYARTESETMVSGYPILIPNLDIRSIGSGGGSIAWIDVAGALHVGPQSAGANPGPVCYGLGGTEPTVTDALVVNGYINPDYFLGGAMKLDTRLSQKSILSNVCKPLNMDLNTGASGMLRMALSNMAEAIKDVAYQKGDDPREFGMLCYGGGGPIFGASLMEELNVPLSIIPVGPANFSALGMLMIDIRHDFVSTLVQKLDTIVIEELRDRFEAMDEKCGIILDKEGIARKSQKVLKSLDMRYVGQEHTVTVPVGFPIIDDDDKKKIYDEFNRVYQNVYGYVLTHPVEVVNLRTIAMGEIPHPSLRKIEAGTKMPDAALKGERKVFCFLKNEWLNHKVYERAKLLAKNIITGPALIEEPTTVTVVNLNQQCEVGPLGNLIITKK